MPLTGSPPLPPSVKPSIHTYGVIYIGTQSYVLSHTTHPLCLFLCVECSCRWGWKANVLKEAFLPVSQQSDEKHKIALLMKSKCM